MKRLLATLALGVLLPVAASAQEWKSYPYPDPGFAVQFPTAPTVERSTSRSAAGNSLPLTRYSVRQARLNYTVDVVDYSTTDAEAMATIAAAEKSFGNAGKVAVAIDARVNRSFGRELSVLGTDGSRSAVAIFFVNKHLYTLVGQALPPNAIERSGDTVRFQESLQFLGANGGGRPGRGFNPQAQAACVGKAAGDAVQLDTPNGTVAATCMLVARPNRPPGGPDVPSPQPAPP